MTPSRSRLARRGARGLAMLAGLLALTGTAGVHAAERTAFKVCADPNYLPYSNRQQEGFENEVAALLAADLGLPVEYTWFPQRMGFIRNTLRAQGEDGEYKCDVVMGVPAGFELTISTRPYYWSTYALVYVRGRGLDDVLSTEDLIALDRTRRNALRFGLAERNPGTVWLARHGMLGQLHKAYASQPGDPNVRPGQLEQEDLLDGAIDLTVMWGPIAGAFARTTTDHEVVVLPMASEGGVRLHFGISAGVRFGQAEWRDQLQGLLDKHAAEIEAILRRHGVPLTDENGRTL